MSKTGGNEEIVQKAITVGSTIAGDTNLNHGGRLSPTQQDEFVKLVKDTSVLLSQVRFVQMPAARHRIDRMWIGEPVTRGVGEKSIAATNSVAKFNQIALDAEKLKSDWQITTELLQENIEQGNMEDALMEMMAKRISTDLEILSIQGDSDAGTGTPFLNLISTFDGYDKLTDGAHIVEASGAGLSRALLATALRRLPEQYLQDTGLRWIMSRASAIDWLEGVAARATVGGDAALNGNPVVNPLGIPAIVVPQLPSTKPVALATTAPGSVTAAEFGPYTVVAGGADTINWDATTTIGSTPAALGGDVEITLNPGIYTVVELAAEIRRALTVLGGADANSILANISFFDDGQGRLVMQTVYGGAAQNIVTQVPTTGALRNFFVLEAGIPNGSYAGAALGAGTINEGTFILLCNPKNLIFGMLDETRIYSEFNKDQDCIETVIYNQVAVNVENLEAIVKITNIRKGVPSGI